MIQHPTLGIPYPKRLYLREQVSIAARNLVKAVKAYLRNVFPKRRKVKPVDQSMQDKLTYWRKNGAPSLSLHDETEAFKSMADGKHYTSKRKYRDDLRAREYEEVGDQRPAEVKKDTVEQDVMKAIGELTNG